MTDIDNNHDLTYAFDVLDKLMRNIFSNETRVLKGFKNPLLNHLRAAFEQFSANPTPASLGNFQEKLQKCEEAENNKVNAENLPLIIKNAEKYMSLYLDNLSQNKQNDSVPRKKP